jgi:hypothetical protein
MWNSFSDLESQRQVIPQFGPQPGQGATYGKRSNQYRHRIEQIDRSTWNPIQGYKDA